VIPESSHPFTAPAASLLPWIGLGRLITYAALKNVRVVEPEDAVVVGQVVAVNRRALARPVVGLAVTDTKNLAKGVIRREGHPGQSASATSR